MSIERGHKPIEMSGLQRGQAYEEKIQIDDVLTEKQEKAKLTQEKRNKNSNGDKENVQNKTIKN